MAAAVLGGAEFGDFDRWSAELVTCGIGGLVVARSAEVVADGAVSIPPELAADWLGGLGAFDIEPDL